MSLETNKTAENATANENAASGTVSEGNSGTSAGGSNNNQTVSSPAPAPTHSHSWSPVYSQVYVVDQAAWTEQIPINRIICSCGAEFANVNDWHAHKMDLGIGTSGHSYRDMSYYDNIYHSEEGHYEQVLDHYECSCGATS